MATFSPSNVDGVRVLHFSGTLNQHGAESIRPALVAEASAGGPLVLDLAGVDMVNTPGIALLLTAHRGVRQSGGRLVVTGSSPMVTEVLHRCLLDRILVLVADPVEAVAVAKSVE